MIRTSGVILCAIGDQASILTAKRQDHSVKVVEGQVATSLSVETPIQQVNVVCIEIHKSKVAHQPILQVLLTQGACPSCVQHFKSI